MLLVVFFRQPIQHFHKFRHQMDKILQTEKRAIQRSWKQREKLIEDAIENAASVLGALSGVAPEASIPRIEAMPAIETLAIDD